MINMDNIDKFIEGITYIGDVDSYLEIANYIIIDVEYGDKKTVNEQIEEYLTINALQEMCKWGITPGTKYLLFDIRFGFDRCLFNSEEADITIYEILYDYIEEGLERHYCEVLPFEERTSEKILEYVKKAITEMDYEIFEQIAEDLF